MSNDSILKMEFKKNNKSIILYKDKYESNDMFLDRGWFIISQRYNNNYQYDEIMKMSKLYVNIKYLNCKYDKDIMNKINFLEKNMLTK